MDIDTSLKPYRPWSSRDYAALAVLVVLAALLFCTGLSLRSLWGSEGRWAVIAREMMRGGNYFLPTINGSVYFDKPLLSYWAIVPFSLFSGVTEVSARLPGALAGIGTVALVFTMGRGLFGYVPGFIAGLLLMTTVMFGFWSRTASAEILNLVAIWSMLWVLPKGDEKRSFARYLLFYLIGAASSFCKGPLALAVALAAVFALSCADLFLDARQAGVRGIRERVVHRFHWILSLKGVLAALCGLTLFAVLLFLPVIVTGSWDAVLLMWRENVLRFVRPFDHVEPFYAYFKHLPVFLLPWTFIAAASLAYMSTWEEDWRRRWLAVVAFTIFMFFTISGSRRSYYILPVVPAFALIMGRCLAGFFSSPEGKFSVVMKTVLIATAFLPVLAGLTMIVGYFKLHEYRHLSLVFLGPAVTIAGAAALFFIFRKRYAGGFVAVAFLMIGILLWVFTAGASLAEKKRTLKPFAQEARGLLLNVDSRTVAMYGVGNSSFLFYLDPPAPIRAFKDLKEVCAFIAATPGGYLVTEETFSESVEKTCRSSSLSRVLVQISEAEKKDGNDLVLFQVPNGGEERPGEDDKEGEDWDSEA